VTYAISVVVWNSRHAFYQGPVCPGQRDFDLIGGSAAAEERLTRKQVLCDGEAVRAALPEVRHFPDTLEQLRRIANAESK